MLDMAAAMRERGAGVMRRPGLENTPDGGRLDKAVGGEIRPEACRAETTAVTRPATASLPVWGLYDRGPYREVARVQGQEPFHAQLRTPATLAEPGNASALVAPADRVH